MYILLFLGKFLLWFFFELFDVGVLIKVQFGIQFLRGLQLQHAFANHAVQRTVACWETKFLAEQVLRSGAGAWAKSLSFMRISPSHSSATAFG